MMLPKSIRVVGKWESPHCVNSYLPVRMCPQREPTLIISSVHILVTGSYKKGRTIARSRQPRQQAESEVKCSESHSVVSDQLFATPWTIQSMEPVRETPPMTRSGFKELARKGIWNSGTAPHAKALEPPGGFLGTAPSSTPRPSSFHLLTLGVLCSLKTSLTLT